MTAAVPARPILVIEHEADDPIGRLGDWLRAAGAELDVRIGPDGSLPATLDGYSGLVVMGGAMAADDDEIAPWLPAVRALLSEAVRDQVPALGVCLGGQLLAAGTGGRVQQAAEAEYGAYLIAKRQAGAVDPLFRELPITPDVIHWHRDEIAELPPGATLLATSPGTEIQAFRMGRTAWGLQFHIETTPALFRTWVAGSDELEGYDVDLLLQRVDAAHEFVEEVWRPFAERFVEFVRDPAAAWAAVPGADPAVGRTSLTMAGTHQHATEVVAEPITDPAAIRAALAAELQASREPHQP